MPLGWIDFSKTERNKVLSVLDMLSEDGVLDELGVAPIRDGFANIFFPGTSTIQTRAKYFFIIPYALKDLEYSNETNPSRLRDWLDEIERTCAHKLIDQNSQGEGVIGKRSIAANKWVKRTPADIYWNGLKQYGFLLAGNYSVGEYIRTMASLKSQKDTLKKLGNRNDNAGEDECDDARAGDIHSMQFVRVPNYDSHWFDSLEMDLTFEEGEYLKNQIILMCPDSLLAFILKNNMQEVLLFKSFAELDALYDRFPDDLKRDYDMAISISDFIYVIRTIYNVIISDGMLTEANDELERLLPQFESISNIDVDSIFERLSIYNNPGLRAFLKNSQKAMANKDLETLNRLITNREISLKGQSRAKTCHPGQNGDKWLGGYGLNYRFRNVLRIINDIFESGGQ